MKELDKYNFKDLVNSILLQKFVRDEITDCVDGRDEYSTTAANIFEEAVKFSPCLRNADIVLSVKYAYI